MPSCHNGTRRTMTLDFVQEYFAHLNPLAQKIASDISNTKSAYGNLWNALNSNDRNDIINETLIKPEVSIKYFENFSATSFTSFSSSSATSPISESIKNQRRTSKLLKTSANNVSAHSLVEVNVDKINRRLTSSQCESQQSKCTPNIPQIIPLSNKSNIHKKNYYGFDGRNLQTYLQQNVALKIVNDDAIGEYRDEHSHPFSYRTKSQMNLNLPHSKKGMAEETSDFRFANREDNDLYLLHFTDNDIRPDKAIDNYKKIVKENTCLKSNKNTNEISKTKNASLITPKVPIAKLMTKSINFEVDSKFSKCPTDETIANDKCGDDSSNLLLKLKTCRKSSIVQRYNSIAGSPKPITFAYNDTYFEHSDCSNLMQSLCAPNTSSSSSTTSDGDEYDEHEKILCEDVKLLDNDISLCKGFDFLNNW